MGARRWWILVALIVGVLPLALDVSLVTVALPAIAQRLPASRAHAVVLAAAYPLVVASLLGPAVLLLRRVGVRRVLLGGLLLAAAGAVGEAAAPSAWPLLGARIVLGMGAAAALPAALATVHAVFEPVEHVRAIAIWAGFTGLGVAMAPLGGGLLVDRHGWEWVFATQVPFLLIALALLGFLLPAVSAPTRSAAPGWSGLTAPVAVFLLAGAAVSAMFGLQLRHGWSGASSGALLALPATAFSVTARAGARWSSRFAPSAGLAVAALATAGLSEANEGWLVGLLLTLIGAGVGLAVASAPGGRRLDAVTRTAAGALGMVAVGSAASSRGLQLGAVVGAVGAALALRQSD